jgi:ABC-type antimicrobial peptide transport system permease subunit
MVIPWSYLLVLTLTSAISMVLAVLAIRRIAGRQVVQSLRNPHLYF